jgi:elongation factor P
MALLQYNEIRTGKVIVYNDEPCVVLDNHVARTQQRKPQNQVKLKSLTTGRTYNETFRSSDTADEADVQKRDIKFLYANKGEYWFCDPTDPANRFKLDEVLLADAKPYLKDNMMVSGMVFDFEDEEKIIGVKLPIKMEFAVKDAPPNIKGDTATGGNKVVTLETGTTINAPLFIEAGERIIVNTETGEYVERAPKN